MNPRPPLALLRPLAFVLLLAVPLAGCDDEEPLPDDPEVIGTLYTMTNAAGGNEVVVYDRLDDGTLDERDRVSTGGNGSGPGDPVPSDPLMSQDALILSPDGHLLFAVNAGSNSIAAFTVEDDGDLDFIEAEPSGGVMPISLTLSRDEEFLYVVHALGSVDGMGAGSINGFAVDHDAGSLTLIADSARPLSGAPETGPAVIAFSPDGDWLAVTEKMTNSIVTYAVDGDGVPGDPIVTTSSSVTPFGAEFTDDGSWIVSNANVPVPLMPVPNGGSASSYEINGDGTLSIVTDESPSYGTAACWIALTADDAFAYTTNTGSMSISGYSVGSNGALTPLDDAALAVLSVANAAPLDMAIADGFLYAVAGDAAGGDGTISVHEIESDGTLTSVDDEAASGLPAEVTGLAAR
jgi:6-phosphogluconolactonase (cycloisomerase 2 family)